MNRRQFVHTSATGLALAAARGFAKEFVDEKPLRVGLIGTGWYGKSDLFRLIQVAPVEVVSLCDVDKKMLADAADMVATRQVSKKRPRTYSDYREMLKEKDLDIVDGRHARPLARVADDRRGRGGSGRLRAEADQRRCRRGAGDARGRTADRPRRASRHAAPQHAASHRSPRGDRQAGKLGKVGAGRKFIVTTTCGRARTRRTLRRQRISITRCGPAPRPCGLTTSSSIRAAGGRSWNTATASWAICASISSIASAGCSILAGRSGSPRPAASSSISEARPKSPDTQTATFDFGDMNIVWQMRSLGRRA